MKRRAVLRGSGTLLVAGALAGCSSGGGTEFALSVSNTEITQTEDGYVAAKVTVTNTGDTAQSGVLYVTAELNGEKSVEVRQVTMDAHSTNVVVVAYDTKYENLTSFSPSANVRPTEEDG